MILERLQKNRIVIYGTGHVAHKFYKVLLHHGLQDQIQCFVRTGKVNEGETLEGIQVHCFEDIHVDEDMLICLAVHESIRSEIEKVVKPVTERYIWIYPYLYELMLGEPEQKGVELQVKTLLKGFHNDLRLGVRLAVIEQQEGINAVGFDYYVRAQMLHCSKTTAAQRLKAFLELIDSWKQSGYRKEDTISINRSYGVIDGNHRLSVAVYTGQKTIYGNIYPTELSVEDIHGHEAMLSKELLLQHGFVEGEIQRLENIQQRYIRAYGSE